MRCDDARVAIPSVPPPPLPPELVRWTVRTPTAADADAIYELTVAVERAIIGWTMVTRSEVEQDLISPTAQLETAKLAVEHDGELLCSPWLAQVNDDHFAGDLQLHPSVSRADGDLLTAWALEWYERIALAVDPVPERIQLGHWSFEADTERGRRLREHGYVTGRVFLRMTRDLPAGERFPDPAPGVVVRPAQIRREDPEFGDARLVHELISTSFADHYNYQAATFEVWFARRIDDAGYDSQCWWVGELDGRPLGAIIMNRELAEDLAGYVSYVGVLREGRGRGLAKALLYKGFETSRDSGYTTVKLFVDADSPTGATKLYDSIGMTREVVTLDWHKWLVPGA